MESALYDHPILKIQGMKQLEIKHGWFDSLDRALSTYQERKMLYVLNRVSLSYSVKHVVGVY